MILIAVRSSVLLALALLGVGLARKNPSLRVAIARAGLLGSLLVLLATPWSRERTQPLIAIQPPVATPLDLRPTPVVQTTKPETPAVPSSTVDLPQSLVPEEAVVVSTTSVDWESLAVMTYGTGVILLLVQSLLGALSLRVIVRRSRQVTSGNVFDTVNQIALELGIRRPELRQSPASSSPFVAGTIHPVLFLPEGWTSQSSGDDRAAVIRHELTHLANGDLRWRALSLLVRTLLWPQPLIWLVLAKGQAAEEEVCDLEVLSSGVFGPTYARTLLDLKESQLGKVPNLGIGAVSKSNLGRRIEAILRFDGPGPIRLGKRLSNSVRLGGAILTFLTAYVFAIPGTDSPTQGAMQHQEIPGARIPIVASDGKPILGAKAWLVLAGSDFDQTGIPQKVEGNEVVTSPFTKERFSTGSLLVRAPGYGLGVGMISSETGLPEKIILGGTTSITGKLILPNGGPAANILVKVSMLTRRDSYFGMTEHVNDPMLTAKTDASGRFTIGGLPLGRLFVHIAVLDPRFANLGSKTRMFNLPTKSGAVQSIPLYPATSISGRVVLAGRPMAGIRVAAQVQDGSGRYDSPEWATTVSGPDGRYTIPRLGNTKYNVAVYLSPTQQVEWTARAVQGVRANGNVTGIDFALEAGTLIEGTVYGPSGKPMRTMIGTYGPAHPNTSANVQATWSDDEGHFRIRVPAGKQFVYVMDGMHTAEANVTTSPDKITQVSLQAKPNRPEGRLVPAEMTKETEQIKIPSEVEKSTPAVMSFGSGKPFYGPVALSNGTRIRVKYIQDASQGNDRWLPHGNAVPERAVASDSYRTIQAVLEIQNPSVEGHHLVVQAPQPPEWSFVGTAVEKMRDGHGRLVDAVTFNAPKNLVSKDLRLGVASGPWKRHQLVERSRATFLQRFQIVPVTLERGRAGKQLAVTIVHPAALRGKDVSLRAFRMDGTEIQLSSVLTRGIPDPKTGRLVQTYTFGSNGSPFEVAHYELRYRNYEWVTFKGIALYPKAN